MKLFKFKRPATNILDEYVLKPPNGQNIIDIFKGEWSSDIPSLTGEKVISGTSPLFQDARVTWAEEVFGSFKNWDILELGPLEGGHTYMFQQSGAKKIIAIEANKRAFMKCLCIKELLNLDKVTFKLGNFIPYLKNQPPKFDMIFASGVLYHMQEPMELLKLISETTERVFIWTHYFDKSILTSHPFLTSKFSKVKYDKFSGFSYEYSIQTYDSLNWLGFCGGPAPISKWLTRDSILNGLKHFGFKNIQISMDHAKHPYGPAFAICAKK